MTVTHTDTGVVITPTPKEAYTHDQRVTIVQNTLIFLKNDSKLAASTAHAGKMLFSLDSTLALSTAELTKKAIANSPGLTKQQEHQLRVNILIGAFEHLNQELQAESKANQAK